MMAAENLNTSLHLYKDTYDWQTLTTGYDRRNYSVR